MKRADSRIIKEKDRTGERPNSASQSSGAPPRKRHAYSASSNGLMKEFDKLIKEGAPDGWVETETRKG